jgi:hypothetical protein
VSSEKTGLQKLREAMERLDNALITQAVSTADDDLTPEESVSAQLARWRVTMPVTALRSSSEVARIRRQGLRARRPSSTERLIEEAVNAENDAPTKTRSEG